MKMKKKCVKCEKGQTVEEDIFKCKHCGGNLAPTRLKDQYRIFLRHKDYKKKIRR